MDKLSDRFMYYAGVLAASGLNVDIDDLKHIQNLIDWEEEGRLIVIDVEDKDLPCHKCAVGWGKISTLGLKSCEEDCVVLKEHLKSVNGY